MSVERTDEDEAAAWLPTTPHEFHALGPLTPANAARVIGIKRAQIHEELGSGELPRIEVFGNVRIEPLVALAARKGGNKGTREAVARALLEGSGVDEIVRLTVELIAAQPPPVRKRRGVKKAPAGGAT